MAKINGIARIAKGAAHFDWAPQIRTTVSAMSRRQKDERSDDQADRSERDYLTQLFQSDLHEMTLLKKAKMQRKGRTPVFLLQAVLCVGTKSRSTEDMDRDRQH